MDWRGGRRSNNIEDQRNSPMAAGVGGLGLILRLLPYLLGTRIGRIILLIAGLGYVGAHFLGIDVLQLLGGRSTSQQTVNNLSPADKEMADFVSVTLANTEDTWRTQFQQIGPTYEEPRLVLFSNRVQSACGFAQAAMGPFYCPGDKKVYIDLSFYQELKTTLGSPGDFAQAYVIAHEVGHHVQNLLGVSNKVSRAQQSLSQTDSNRLSVKLELQADCFAGIWAHFADSQRKIIEAGDIEEALKAAENLGDDKLQRQATGDIRPERFTHGTSAQRASWFKRGLDEGTLEACNTFAAAK